MDPTAALVLKHGRERSVERRHPWIFSGAIESIKGNPTEGDLVAVFSSSEEFLCLGHYGSGSLSVKVLTYENGPITPQFWGDRIAQAYQLRRKAQIAESPQTTAFRLVNGEGDFLPGLIVDLYSDVAVIQHHSLGMRKSEEEIVASLKNTLQDRVAVIGRSSLKDDKGSDASKLELIWSKQTEPNLTPEILENGHRFLVDIERGQKTGFFLDQRDNRALVKEHSKGRKVLNAFSYSAGFSVSALAGGAEAVVSVDSSKDAIQLAERNVKANNFSEKHTGVVADCFDYLREIDQKFDLIVLDPPAFAKHRDAVNQAARGYQSINREAIRQIQSGGLIFTFSCSQVIDSDLFRKIVFSAAAEAKRDVRVLKVLGAGVDHPVSIFHPEGEYLKGLMLEVS